MKKLPPPEVAPRSPRPGPQTTVGLSGDSPERTGAVSRNVPLRLELQRLATERPPCVLVLEHQFPWLGRGVHAAVGVAGHTVDRGLQPRGQPLRRPRAARTDVAPSPADPTAPDPPSRPARRGSPSAASAARAPRGWSARSARRRCPPRSRGPPSRQPAPPVAVSGRRDGRGGPPALTGCTGAGGGPAAAAGLARRRASCGGGGWREQRLIPVQHHERQDHRDENSSFHVSATCGERVEAVAAERSALRQAPAPKPRPRTAPWSESPRRVVGARGVNRQSRRRAERRAAYTRERASSARRRGRRDGGLRHGGASRAQVVRLNPRDVCIEHLPPRHDHDVDSLDGLVPSEHLAREPLGAIAVDRRAQLPGRSDAERATPRRRWARRTAS